MTYPILKGTEAQVKWAEDIRTKAISKYDFLSSVSPEDLSANAAMYAATKQYMMSLVTVGCDDYAAYDALKAIEKEIEAAKDEIMDGVKRSDPTRAQKMAEAAAVEKDIILKAAMNALTSADNAAAWIKWSKR